MCCILLLDRNIAKQSDSILFVKIENDGFDLGAQRRPNDKSDLPNAFNVISKYKAMILNKDKTKLNNSLCSIVEKKEIVKDNGFPLTGDRYKTSKVLTSNVWPMVSLNKVCEILNGFAFKSSEYVEQGLRIIRITNVQKGVIVDDNPKFVDIKRKKEFKSYELYKNDILISLTGNVGRVGLISQKLLPALLNQRVGCIRSKDNIVHNYLFHILNNEMFEEEAIKHSKGDAQANLSTKWLQGYELPLPSIEVQKEIVAELDGYQNIINGAKQVIENYKPQIKIEPSWELAPLKEFCSFVRGPFGGSLKKEIFVKEGYRVYEQKNAIRNDFDIVFLEYIPGCCFRIILGVDKAEPVLIILPRKIALIVKTGITCLFTELDMTQVSFNSPYTMLDFPGSH